MQEESENKQYKNLIWHIFQVMYKKSYFLVCFVSWIALRLSGCSIFFDSSFLIDFGWKINDRQQIKYTAWDKKVRKISYHPSFYTHES